MNTQQLLEFPIIPRYSFDNFVVCSGNRTAFHFARQLTTGDGTDNLIYLHGPSGSGKTHLLMAIATSLGMNDRDNRAATEYTLPFISFKEVHEFYGGEYPTEGDSRIDERFRGAPALLVDDIHLIPDNASIRLGLWQVFNDFYSAGKPIAITGLYPPRELPNLDGHLISRLLWGLVAKVDVSDDDSRRMIMKKLAEDRQVLLPADVIDYLIHHTRRDIPSLVDALELIRRHALATKRKIGIRLAREALHSGE